MMSSLIDQYLADAKKLDDRIRQLRLELCTALVARQGTRAFKLRRRIAVLESEHFGLMSAVNEMRKR